ncbi:LPS assembly lipoprotein LptE [Flavisolibacter ginsenosidimutans]|uniref:LptE family protein n=1 Tax=Flavisolibacter ginsenosidimutans TaxID=661481 RepID=A0A5B8UF27_9BACT|nr:LPS assembly lipoprotein LptE [Flavisolibacter ginsenosidimutans]QEC54906.1 hypothetical protein FSB75_02980 [Flavisolibacter ginsenosidimutans]
MKSLKNKQKAITAGVLLFAFLLLSFALLSCKVSYGFNEKTSSIPDSVKTVRINLIENRAPYQNPQLSPLLTEQLKRKVTNQTKLTMVNANNTNPDWEISGEIRDYSVSTTGVTSTNGQSQSSINRLTVTVHISINKRSKTDEYDVSRSFDFSARQSLQQAEASLLDEMVRNLTDEIFNRLFSDW